MKKMQIRLAVLIIVVGVLCGCSVNAQQIITPEQAMNAVRVFENNQNLQFSSVKLYESDDSIEWMRYKEYNFDDTNYNNSWSVNAFSAEICSVVYSDRIPDYDIDHPVFGIYSQSQCQDFALTYARQKYQGFDNMNFIAEAPEWIGTGWMFIWQQKLSYDALTLNNIEIEVNPDTGEIQCYRSRRVGVTNPIQAPQVSSQEAIEIAQQAFEIITIEGTPHSSLIADPLGDLYWNVGIKGYDSNDYLYVGYVYINMSGLVIQKTSATSSGVFKKSEKKQSQITKSRPAIKYNKKSNAKAGCKSINAIPLHTIKLPSNQKIENMKVVKNIASFMFNKKLYKLNNDSNILIFGTKKYKMSGKCSIENFIVYVPSDFGKTLMETTKPAKTIKSTKVIKAVSKKLPVKAKK